MRSCKIKTASKTTQRCVVAPSLDLRFESCVVLDGDKTEIDVIEHAISFESCVVLDGDKTVLAVLYMGNKFESCVVLDGDKTPACAFAWSARFTAQVCES